MFANPMSLAVFYYVSTEPIRPNARSAEKAYQGSFLCSTHFPFLRTVSGARTFCWLLFLGNKLHALTDHVVSSEKDEKRKIDVSVPHSSSSCFALLYIVFALDCLCIFTIETLMKYLSNALFPDLSNRYFFAQEEYLLCHANDTLFGGQCLLSGREKANA